MRVGRWSTGRQSVIINFFKTLGMVPDKRGLRSLYECIYTCSHNLHIHVHLNVSTRVHIYTSPPCALVYIFLFYGINESWGNILSFSLRTAAVCPHLVSVLFGKRCGSNDVLPLESYDDLNFRVTIPEEAQLCTLKVSHLLTT